jgi:hypothetical protein
MSDEKIVSRKLSEICTRKGKTDWSRVGSFTDEDIDLQAEDPDVAPISDDLSGFETVKNAG